MPQPLTMRSFRGPALGLGRPSQLTERGSKPSGQPCGTPHEGSVITRPPAIHPPGCRASMNQGAEVLIRVPLPRRKRGFASLRQASAVRSGR